MSVNPRKAALSVCLVLVIVGIVWVFSPLGPLGKKHPNAAMLSQSDTASLQNDLDSIISNYRKIIVLLEDDKSLNNHQAKRADMIARDLYYKNQKLLSRLSEKLTSETDKVGRQSFTTVPAMTTRFMDQIENFTEWHDADKLVFFEIVEDLIETVDALPETYRNKAGLHSRLVEDLKTLKEIQSLYNKELDKIFGRFETRGMVFHREAWEAYVTYLKTKFTRDMIFKEFDKIDLGEKEKEQVPPKKEETNKSEFPPQGIVLTFDDGPHNRYTPRIMEILKNNGVKAVFFELGSNLGSFKEDHTIQRSKSSKISEELVKSGFYLANHSFSHAILSKLSDKDLRNEVEWTNELLMSVTDKPTTLFRPPYGAQNEKVLSVLKAHHLRSLLWHVDSKDWADPIPKSIADRVVREVAQKKHGIILFHDINPRTVEALPLIIETLKKDGYNFLSWDGTAFVDENRGAGAPALKQAPSPQLYRESWAVIIGIDKYQQWPKLQYAVNDAQAIREILINKYRFKTENIHMLLNDAATREQILSVLGDTMGNSEKVKKDDRVFIFFAGHGATRKLSSGRYLGYIVPVNADLQNYQGQSISMTNFQDISEAIPAKHVFFVMDSCYSGLGLTRAGGVQVNTANYLREVARRNSRQMLTAGGMDEQVADNGPNGHSVFTWTLLQGLEGKADLNGDGYITASELSAYLGPGVSAISKQTPSFGNLPGSEGGDFIFDPKQENEFLSELSTQLDEEAIHLNSQLEAIRKQIAQKKLRNEKLRKELSSVQTQVDGKDGKLQISPIDNTQLSIAKHIEQGNALFKEKKYNEALAEYLAANKLNPSNALAVNNIGYVYYKMGQYDLAVQWFEKTIALDPRRSIAYSNIGEAYLKLNRKSDAKKALEKYLELAPNSRYATEISGKLKSIE
jgi:peptidoglycan/xylan/chitin deacetylase (PgdA/CDA1 family)/uncharacterized caspase-like protein